MSDLRSAGEAERGATMAQLRHDIDSGRTGDKVAGFDPAAAPLGTDDEAAGAPPSPQTVARERADARRGAQVSTTANAATPAMAPDARFGPETGVVLAGVAAAVALGALLFAVL